MREVLRSLGRLIDAIIWTFVTVVVIGEYLDVWNVL